MTLASNIGRKKLGCMFDTRFHLTLCTRSHSFLAKNVFCHGNGRHCLWPTSIERQVSNDFLELRFGEAIFFRLLQVKRELLRVAANDERSNGNQAAVTRCEFLALPHISKQDIVSERDQLGRKVANHLLCSSLRL